MKKIKAWLGAGIVMSVVSLVISFLVQLVFPFDPSALPGMRSMSDPWMLLFFAYPFLLSAVMVWVFNHHGESFKGNARQKSLSFGTMVWLLTGLPSFFIVWTSMTYPLGFHVDSLLGSLATVFSGAFVLVKMLEK